MEIENDSINNENCQVIGKTKLQQQGGQIKNCQQSKQQNKSGKEHGEKVDEQLNLIDGFVCPFCIGKPFKYNIFLYKHLKNSHMKKEDAIKQPQVFTIAEIVYKNWIKLRHKFSIFYKGEDQFQFIQGIHHNEQNANNKLIQDPIKLQEVVSQVDQQVKDFLANDVLKNLKLEEEFNQLQKQLKLSESSPQYSHLKNIKIQQQIIFNGRDYFFKNNANQNQYNFYDKNNDITINQVEIQRLELLQKNQQKFRFSKVQIIELEQSYYQVMTKYVLSDLHIQANNNQQNQTLQRQKSQENQNSTLYDYQDAFNLQDQGQLVFEHYNMSQQSQQNILQLVYNNNQIQENNYFQKIIKIESSNNNRLLINLRNLGTDNHKHEIFNQIGQVSIALNNRIKITPQSIFNYQNSEINIIAIDDKSINGIIIVIIGLKLASIPLFKASSNLSKKIQNISQESILYFSSNNKKKKRFQENSQYFLICNIQNENELIQIVDDENYNQILLNNQQLECAKIFIKGNSIYIEESQLSLQYMPHRLWKQILPVSNFIISDTAQFLLKFDNKQIFKIRFSKDDEVQKYYRIEQSRSNQLSLSGSRASLGFIQQHQQQQQQNDPFLIGGQFQNDQFMQNIDPNIDQYFNCQLNSSGVALTSRTSAQSTPKTTPRNQTTILQQEQYMPITYKYESINEFINQKEKNKFANNLFIRTQYQEGKQYIIAQFAKNLQLYCNLNLSCLSLTFPVQNQWEDQQVSQVFSSLKQLKHIKHFEFILRGQQKITQNSIQNVITFIETNNKTIETLKLDFSFLQFLGENQNLNQLQKIILQISNIKIIYIALEGILFTIQTAQEFIQNFFNVPQNPQIAVSFKNLSFKISARTSRFIYKYQKELIQIIEKNCGETIKQISILTETDFSFILTFKLQQSSKKCDNNIHPQYVAKFVKKIFDKDYNQREYQKQCQKINDEIKFLQKLLKFQQENENSLLSSMSNSQNLKEFTFIDDNFNQISVPKFIASFNGGFISEYTGLSLNMILFENPNFFNDKNIIKQLIAQISCLMAWMNSKGLMQADIKPHNITFKDGKFFVIDFSNSIDFFKLAKCDKVILPGGTFNFVSPNTKPRLRMTFDTNTDCMSKNKYQYDYKRDSNFSTFVTGSINTDLKNFIVQQNSNNSIISNVQKSTTKVFTVTNAPKHDIFSFGATILYVLKIVSLNDLCQTSFCNQSEIIKQNNYSLEQLLGNLQLKEILIRMLDKDINLRPDFHEVRDILFYSEICSPSSLYIQIPTSNRYVNAKFAMKKIDQQQQSDKTKIDNLHIQNQRSIDNNLSYQQKQTTKLILPPHCYLKQYKPPNNILLYLKLDNIKPNNPQEKLLNEYIELMKRHYIIYNNKQQVICDMFRQNKIKENLKIDQNIIKQILYQDSNSAIEKFIQIYQSDSNFYNILDYYFSRLEVDHFAAFFSVMMWDRYQLKDYQCKDKVAYRSLGFESTAVLIDTIAQFVEGFEYCWPCFTNITTNKDFAVNFPKEAGFSDCLLFEIHFNEQNKWNKFDISKFSKYQQKEILLYPFFYFKIESVIPVYYKQYDKNICTIKIIELQQQWCSPPPQCKILLLQQQEQQPVQFTEFYKSYKKNQSLKQNNSMVYLSKQQKEEIDKLSDKLISFQDENQLYNFINQDQNTDKWRLIINAKAQNCFNIANKVSNYKIIFDIIIFTQLQDETLYQNFQETNKKISNIVFKYDQLIQCLQN